MNKLAHILAVLADNLDQLDLRKEADFVDRLIKSAATITFEDEEGEEHEIPTKNELCPTCDGEGKIDNPAFENGITSSEWDRDWDEEERGQYMRGAYDVKCPECKGSKVIKAPDLDQLKPELKAKYLKHLEEEDAFAREQASERRMGA